MRAGAQRAAAQVSAACSVCVPLLAALVAGSEHDAGSVVDSVHPLLDTARDVWRSLRHTALPSLLQSVGVTPRTLRLAAGCGHRGVALLARCVASRKCSATQRCAALSSLGSVSLSGLLLDGHEADARKMVAAVTGVVRDAEAFAGAGVAAVQALMRLVDAAAEAAPTPHAPAADASLMEWLRRPVQVGSNCLPALACPAVLQCLGKALAHPSKPLAVAAATALTHPAVNRDYEGLLLAVHSMRSGTSSAVRAAAATGLGHLQAPWLARVLLGGVFDPHPLVVQACCEALQRLDVHTLGAYLRQQRSAAHQAAIAGMVQDALAAAREASRRGSKAECFIPADALPMLQALLVVLPAAHPAPVAQGAPGLGTPLPSPGTPQAEQAAKLKAQVEAMLAARSASVTASPPSAPEAPGPSTARGTHELADSRDGPGLETAEASPRVQPAFMSSSGALPAAHLPRSVLPSDFELAAPPASSHGAGMGGFAAFARRGGVGEPLSPGE